MQKMTEELLQETEEITNAATEEPWNWWERERGVHCIGSKVKDHLYEEDGPGTHIVADAITRPQNARFAVHARTAVPILTQTVRKQAATIEELQKVVDAAREYRTAKTVYAIHRTECIECQEELDCSAGEQLWRQELDTATRFCGALNVYDAYVAALDTKWQKRRGKSTHPQEGVSGNE